MINVGATFQRDMGISFRGLINKEVVVYLDDATMFSKRREDQLMNLRNFFNRCRKYDISLNPKKSIFIVTIGKLLVFVVSKEGMRIETRRT